MKVSKIQEKGWKLLINLFKAANDDSIITFDEGRIVRTTDLNVTKLYTHWAMERPEIPLFAKRVQNYWGSGKFPSKSLQ